MATPAQAPVDASIEAMSSETFYGYMYPLQNRRYYLALVLSVLLFPLIAVALILGTVVLIVPFFGLLLWFGMRVFFARMLGNSILVSEENYPRINRIAEEVKARLGYKKRIYVFVYESGSFNAYMRHIFFRRAVFLNSELLQAGVTDSEARWIIGRFVGYMRARQQAGALGWIIRAARYLGFFNFFILPYERAMVYTGDRLALAELDGDLASAISAMQKLLVGRELGYSVNPVGLIEQHRQVKGTFFGFLARATSSYPHTTARYLDLVLFTKAFFPDQFAAFQAANPGLPDDLDRLGVSQISASGERRPARAPMGWAWAGGTLSVLIMLGVLVWNSLPTGPSYAGGYNTYSPVSVTEPVAQPTMRRRAPPNTHYNTEGKLAPNVGCRWVTDDPNDLRAVCK
jgi:hypothetical protein